MFSRKDIPEAPKSFYLYGGVGQLQFLIFGLKFSFARFHPGAGYL